MLNPKVYLNLALKASLEEYTSVMFKAYANQPFVWNWHHKAIIKALQLVQDGKIKKLMINMPPRHTKTELAVKMFCSQGFALNPRARFMHLSYSDTLVKNNSASIKDIMQLPIYQSIFPHSRLAATKQSDTEWRTEHGGVMYATSTQGQVTGFGAGLVDDETERVIDPSIWDPSIETKLDLLPDGGEMFNGALIIDDPAKPEDALSATLRDKINQRYDTTIRNRVNSRNTPIILIMQRLHKNDLCGYLLETEPGEWTVLSLPAILEPQDCNKPIIQDYIPKFDTGRKALWEFKMQLDELDALRAKNAVVFDTQYGQNPRTKEGLLYEEFGTYTELPQGIHARKARVDPADTGKDNLCLITFNQYRGDPHLYVTDVLYTPEKAEITEPKCTRMLQKNCTELVLFEANNGGRLYASNIEKNLRAAGNHEIKVKAFHQSENKLVRIMNNAPRVNNLIKFPSDWKERWPRFYADVTDYRSTSTQLDVDDGPDTLTGVYEMCYPRVKKKMYTRAN